MIFRPADILIPKLSDMTAWSVVACDQFTSEPEYWEQVRGTVGDKPSALRLIIPEAELGKVDTALESERIYETMNEYLRSGVFTEYQDSFVYLERRLSSGVLRRGLIGAIDLEAYDWAEGSTTPVRATEHTVEDRLPPRVAVRCKASLEMPHIMVFIDDPEDTVFSSVSRGECVYDFELMQGGGHVTGYRVADNAALISAIGKLSDEEQLRRKYGTDASPVIFAMGDGNHSIAAAKKYWEQVKSETGCTDHPARYALCEVVNIHDPAITFEPIHKLIFGTDPSEFISFAKDFFSDRTGEGKTVKLVSGDESIDLGIAGLTLGELIGECERLCVEYTKMHGGSIDYIHGDGVLRSLASREDSCGVMLPKMEKSELFTSVMRSGPFPKKSFSIGHGPDKRYYLECRKIK